MGYKLQSHTLANLKYDSINTEICSKDNYNYMN